MTDPESGRFTTRYLDRRAAGRALAPRLRNLSGLPGLVVLGLPRGGVPVADEVARSLGAPLDVLVVRKLGVPGQEELAFGAIAEGGARWLNEGLIQALGLDAATIARVTREQQEELGRRVALFRQGRPAVALEGRVVVVVDDGLATGATTYAAVQALRARTPTRIIVAVPVASREACALLRPAVDELVVAATPEPFHGVGAWYDDFRQTTDDEVGDILAAAATRS